MGRKQKYSKEIKLLAIQKYQDGFKSKCELAIELECSIKSIDQWIRNYKSIGESAFNNKPRNQAYTKELKTEVILTGGLLAENTYWVVADTVAIGVGSTFQGVILTAMNVSMNTGSSIVGMIYAQTSVSFDATTAAKA
ncbi:ice-binding family protein [Peloplasma aerotolerans]|uniref:Ice-binding family protein n=1 Tax=Peloplasma aerotolerans TaxID=3044389 RepID=A0AAW6U513_9MOLU|nr:ice-binding family protein [Mariniplasma sp. M4Ah]MDI6453068.1 ice-binding family protein [Mariniplasma sp. M4Ah]MDR4968987.1 ice-binding family protein [Acholeplasmataceae bacterium]